MIVKLNTSFKFSWLILFLLILHYTGYAQNTKGTDFWFGYPSTIGDTVTNPTYQAQKYVYISSQNATAVTGTISITGISYTNNFTVPANSTIQIHLPLNTQPFPIAEGTFNIAVHITSSDSVTVRAQITRYASDDETIVYPTAILENDYMILDWNERISTSLDHGDEFMIVATQDNTQINITPNVNTDAGHTANVTYAVTINKGQVYQVRKSSLLSDTSLSGTTVSSNAPIAVFSADYETNVGGNVSADHLFAQLMPLSFLGTNYILVAHKAKPFAATLPRAVFYRIMATQDNTCIAIDGNTVATLNKGKFYQDSSSGVNYVCTDKPVMIAQFAESKALANSGNTGDPFKTMMYPLKHLATSVRFNMNDLNNVKDFWVNIIVRTANVSGTLLDGTSIASNFTAVPSNPVFSYAQIRIDSLDHTIDNPNGFLAYAYAWHGAISYGYFLGFNKVLKDTVTPTTGCIGDTIHFGALAFNSTTNYTWHFGDGNTSTSQSTSHTYSATGTYTVVLNKLNTAGCSTAENDTFTIIITNSINAGTLNGTQTLCPTDTSQLSTTGDSGGTWSSNNTSVAIVNSSGLVTAISVGTATIKYKLTGGSCGSDSAMITITVTTGPNAGTLNGLQTLCPTDTSQLNTTGDPGGTWSSSNTGVATINSLGFVTAIAVGTTTIKYKLTGGSCGSDSATITITVTNPPIAMVSSNSPICEGSTLKLNASDGNIYTWSGPNGFSSLQQNPTISPVTTSAAGTYSVIVSNGGSCTDTATLNITINPAPNGSACCPATIKSGDNSPLSVTPTNSNYTYQWSPSSSLSCDTCTSTTATPTESTWYSVIITDSNGCRIADSVLITVIENCGAIYVPTAFSPNGDNFNDVLKVFGNCIKTMNFTIYDRWGNKVFKSTDPQSGWDGTYKGKAMNVGTYVYTLEATDINNKLTKKTGNISLIR